MDWPILTRQSRGLGSAIDLQIALDAPTRAAEAEHALDAALAWIAAAEARLSRFRPTSELCALNRAAGDWFAASADLYAIVTTALDWAARTAGLFDPTVLGALESLGYDRSFEEIAHRDIGKETTSPHPSSGAYTQVQLDPARQAIKLPVGVGIDLGGIGKGWVADGVAATVLGDFANVLVNIGGDLAVRGGVTVGGCWVIGIRDPRSAAEAAPRYLGGVSLRQGGVATSGPQWRWWQRDGVPLHHLIDPRTGWPAATVSRDPTASALAAVTALATTATAAEVAAKHALLLGLPAGLTTLDCGTDLAGVWILGDGRLVPSANLAAYLDAHGQRP